MPNPLLKILNWVSEKFSKDASKMLIYTGVASWTLSSLAQIAAILFNKNISKEQKSYLIPQEMADAVTNIGAFFLVTQFTKRTVSKLFSTGKFAPKKVRTYLEKNKNLYGDKIGKLDFDLDKVLNADILNFPKDEYYTCKNFYTTLATVGAGILSSNIITPIVRNEFASGAQKKLLKNDTSKKPIVPKPQVTTIKSSGLRV